MARTTDQLNASEIITVGELDSIAANSVIYVDNSGVFQRLALGTSGKVLTSNGATSAPTFETNASGDFSGPASSTDNAIVRFDGTGGKTGQNSGVTIADTTNDMAGVGTLGCGAITTSGNILFSDPGTSSNSYSITLTADNSGTPQLGTLFVAYGATPYIRISPPNGAGTATATIDLSTTALTFPTDNTVDIGASGATRPKDIFAAGNISAGGNVTGTTILGTTFDTNVAAAACTLVGTTWAADGTDANIDLTITPKGAAGIAITDTTAPGTTTNKLYSVSGDLFRNGVEVVKKTVELVVVDFTTATATGDGKFYFRVPSELNGMDLVGIVGNVITAGTTNTTDVQLHNLTDGVDMLSTVLTIDSGETTSLTADTPVAIDATKDDVVTDDILRVDVDAVSDTPAQGLLITLEFRKP